MLKGIFLPFAVTFAQELQTFYDYGSKVFTSNVDSYPVPEAFYGADIFNYVRDIILKTLYILEGASGVTFLTQGRL